MSEEDPDSTFGVYKKQLLPHIPQLKEEQFVKIKQGVSGEIWNQITKNNLIL